MIWRAGEETTHYQLLSWCNSMEKDKLNGSQNPLLIYKSSLKTVWLLLWKKSPEGKIKLVPYRKGCHNKHHSRKAHVMYKHTFIAIVIPWQGCPVQVSDVLQSRAHEVMDVLLNTSSTTAGEIVKNSLRKESVTRREWWTWGMQGGHPLAFLYMAALTRRRTALYSADGI